MPFNDAKVKVIRIFLRKFGRLFFLQFVPAELVWQHRMLYDILINGFHQRVICHSLHENRAIVMFGRCCDIQLQAERAVFL